MLRTTSSGLLLTTSRERLEEVFGRCSTLKRDISNSHRRLHSDLVDTFTRCRIELEQPLGRRWKNSPVYVSGRERILRKQQDETELHTQLTRMKSQLDCEHQIRLSVKKTLKMTGKKARNVEEPILVNAQSIGTFLLAREMTKDQRDFGSLIKPSKDSGIDDMSEFWKAEIGKYEKERKDRMHGPELTERAKRVSLLTVPVRNVQGLSPLQVYVQKYTREKILGKGSDFQIRNRQEERMNSIQPSPDVALLARKYHSRPALQPLNIQKTHRKPVTRTSISVPKVYLDDNREDVFLKSEIRRELQDTERQLNIEAIISDEVRKTRKRNASSMR